jgi:hypothetical protein
MEGKLRSSDVGILIMMKIMSLEPIPTNLLGSMADLAAKRLKSGDVPGTDEAMRDLFDAHTLVFGVWWDDEIACVMLLKGRNTTPTATTESTAIPCLDQEDAEWHRLRFGEGPITRH